MTIILKFNRVKGLPVWLSGKKSACSAGVSGFDPWVGKIPWRRKRQPAPAFFPGKPHGQRSPQSRGSQESWTRLSAHTHTHTHTTESREHERGACPGLTVHLPLRIILSSPQPNFFLCLCSLFFYWHIVALQSKLLLNHYFSFPLHTQFLKTVVFNGFCLTAGFNIQKKS